MLRDESSEKRAMDHQLRSHLDDVVVAEDALGIITSSSISEGTNSSDSLALLLVAHDIVGILLSRFLLNARAKISGGVLQFSDPLADPVRDPSGDVWLEAARDRPKKTMDRGDVNEGVVPHVCPNLPGGDFGIGDASYALSA
ncbi:protein of unknown function [Azospirillum baldaniorum]|uniref:Uncharacterized protein n=1 Tax=Azospirillum baldaniorum TaxID=1064539 RepID=A0A9P1NN37_9PROT|nr:protein of unknown function [Azospirillum baldaniorum]